MLPLSEFNKNKNSRDGLQDVCRDCFSEYNKKRYALDRRENGGSDMTDEDEMTESDYVQCEDGSTYAEAPRFCPHCGAMVVESCPE